MTSGPKLPARTPDVISRRVGDDFVVVHPGTQAAHSLTGVPAQVWAATEGAELPDLEAAAIDAAIAELTALDLLQLPGISRRSMVKRAGIVAGVAGVATVALPEALAAASTKFSYTQSKPGNYNVTVPAGVTKLSFTLVGAGGGAAQGAISNQANFGYGGQGATVSGTVTIPSSKNPTILTIGVGAGGAEFNSNAAASAGGSGSGNGGAGGGAGGGGGTALATSGGTLLVLAGGGGGGGTGSGTAFGFGYGGVGGDAGVIDGTNKRSVAKPGGAPGRTPAASKPGSPGTGGETTTKGTSNPGAAGSDFGGPTITATTAGSGSNGGRGGSIASGAGGFGGGGGGGGGYAGGGGGGTGGDGVTQYNAGGGGGSSYADGATSAGYQVAGVTSGLAANNGTASKAAGNGMITLTQVTP